MTTRKEYIDFAKKYPVQAEYNIMRLFAIFDIYYPRRVMFGGQAIKAKAAAVIRQDRLDDIKRGEE